MCGDWCGGACTFAVLRLVCSVAWSLAALCLRAVSVNVGVCHCLSVCLFFCCAVVLCAGLDEIWGNDPTDHLRATSSYMKALAGGRRKLGRNGFSSDIPRECVDPPEYLRDLRDRVSCTHSRSPNL